MLDIEKKLSEGGETYKNEVLESLHLEAQKIKELVDRGVNPDEYAKYSKYITALDTSILVLNKYKEADA